jgi:hypothetical protein
MQVSIEAEVHEVVSQTVGPISAVSDRSLRPKLNPYNVRLVDAEVGAFGRAGNVRTGASYVK